MKLILSFLSCGFITYLPSLAYACAVCADPNDEARIAFIFTTGLLTFCPLIAMWLIFSWLRNAAREFEQEEHEARPGYTNTNEEGI